MSNFAYCPLTWPFRSKVANDEINGNLKRELRTLYGDFESKFEELLVKAEAKNKKNLQNLIVETWNNKPFQSIVRVGYFR